MSPVLTAILLPLVCAAPFVWWLRWADHRERL